MKTHIWHSVTMAYKCCILGDSRSIMKDSLHEEHCTLTALSVIPFKGISWISISGNRWQCPTKVVCFVENGLQWVQFTRNTQHLLFSISYSIHRIFLKIHIRHTLTVAYKCCNWWRSVFNKGQFTWRTQNLLCSISYSIVGIFLKTHISHTVTVAYKCC